MNARLKLGVPCNLDIRDRAFATSLFRWESAVEIWVRQGCGGQLQRLDTIEVAAQLARALASPLVLEDGCVWGEDPLRGCPIASATLTQLQETVVTVANAPGVAISGHKASRSSVIYALQALTCTPDEWTSGVRRPFVRVRAGKRGRGGHGAVYAIAPFVAGIDLSVFLPMPEEPMVAEEPPQMPPAATEGPNTATEEQTPTRVPAMMENGSRGDQSVQEPMPPAPQPTPIAAKKTECEWVFTELEKLAIKKTDGGHVPQIMASIDRYLGDGYAAKELVDAAAAYKREHDPKSPQTIRFTLLMLTAPTGLKAYLKPKPRPRWSRENPNILSGPGRDGASCFWTVDVGGGSETIATPLEIDTRDKLRGWLMRPQVQERTTSSQTQEQAIQEAVGQIEDPVPWLARAAQLAASGAAELAREGGEAS